MTVATGSESASRAALYRSLVWRNRIVGLLRFGVPLLGACVLAYILLQIAIDTVSNRFGIASVRIDRDNLVVETPHVTQTGPDGTLYALRARAARVAANDPDRIDMQDAVFAMTPPDRPAVQAEAAAASFKVHDQLLDIPGLTSITGSDGMAGTLADIHADLIARSMAARGPVDLTLHDGTTLRADGMSYDDRTGLYVFTHVQVMLPMLPGEAP